MKKSIILMLVFGFAAMANATLQISINEDTDPVDSEIWLELGGNLTLDVHTDTTLNYLGTYLLMLVDAADGTLSGGYPTMGNLSENLNHYICDPYYFLYFIDCSETSAVAGLVADADNGFVFPVGKIYDGIDFECLAAPGDAVVSLYSSADSVIWALDDTVTIHQVSDLTPLIGVEPYTLNFFVEENGLDPDDQVLSVWNAGTGTLNWTIEEEWDKLTVTPDSGASSGEINAVVVSVDSGLPPGKYTYDFTVTDPNAANSPQTVTINLTNECIFDDSPMYDDWVGAGKNWSRPDCWCYERQCRGDGDGCRIGIFWIQTADLEIFASAYNVGDAKLDQTKICADFDHKKVGVFRVQTNDLIIFSSFLSIGSLKVPVCPLDWEATYTYPMTSPPTAGTPDGQDDYNFWITPDNCP